MESAQTSFKIILRIQLLLMSLEAPRVENRRLFGV